MYLLANILFTVGAPRLQVPVALCVACLNAHEPFCRLQRHVFLDV